MPALSRKAGHLALTIALTVGGASCAPAGPAAPANTMHRPSFDLQAHRGGRGETTEESLRAFAKALELGVTTLELDIVISKDGEALVWHDPRIEATKCEDTAPAFPDDPQYPYVGKLVHELTLPQIHTLDCGKRLDAFPDAEVVPRNKIATLREVFALADAYGADVRYNIETKVEAAEPTASASPAEFVDIIVAAVRAAGKVDRVSIQSFDWRTLVLVQKVEPALIRVALWDDTTWKPGSPWLAGVDPAVTDPIAGAKSVGANVLSPRYSLVDRAFNDRAHAAGVTVVPWTVNDAAAMREQIAAGVDGIITDYPGRLRAVMAELRMPLPRAYARSQ